MLEQHSLSFRNWDRTNRPLDLVRLHLTGGDDACHNHRILRIAAEAAGGRGERQGRNRDTRGAASLR